MDDWLVEVHKMEEQPLFNFDSMAELGDSVHRKHNYRNSYHLAVHWVKT